MDFEPFLLHFHITSFNNFTNFFIKMFIFCFSFYRHLQAYGCSFYAVCSPVYGGATQQPTLGNR